MNVQQELQKLFSHSCFLSFLHMNTHVPWQARGGSLGPLPVPRGGAGSGREDDNSQSHTQDHITHKGWPYVKLHVSDVHVHVCMWALFLYTATAIHISFGFTDSNRIGNIDHNTLFAHMLTLHLLYNTINYG